MRDLATAASGSVSQKLPLWPCYPWLSCANSTPWCTSHPAPLKCRLPCVAAHTPSLLGPRWCQPWPLLLVLSCSDSERDSRSINDVGLQFKFIVPSAVVGAVLGRGGATVAAIKRETGAYVQFTRPGTATNSPKERMMIVAVERRDQLPKAIELVFQVGAGQLALQAFACQAWARGTRLGSQLAGQHTLICEQPSNPAARKQLVLEALGRPGAALDSPA